MRPRSRRWTSAITTLGTAVFAASALAAEAPIEGDALEAESLFPYERERPAERRQERQEQRDRRARRRQARMLVHPLEGKPDYGTAENAFGASRSGHAHAGHDVFAPVGTPLVAVSQGVVAETGSDGEQGNYLYLYDEERNRTYVYMHMIAPANVKTGERVDAGERVGGLGCTGSCFGDHLHFEVRAGKGIAGEPRDPLPLLKQWERGAVA
jgi:murein DD-endopeptidase MepM/ murein hydrolase activator NlpD